MADFVRLSPERRRGQRAHAALSHDTRVLTEGTPTLACFMIWHAAYQPALSVTLQRAYQVEEPRGGKGDT